MIIRRPKYEKMLKDAIYNQSIKCIVLDGPRHAGKTTLLQHLYHDDSIEVKKYYYAFDDQISTKQFKDSNEFISFMQIKFGIDFMQSNILFLNEIQYSKNIGIIIHDLINTHKIKTKIVATGITQGEYKDFLKLREEDFTVITIHILSFMEFLEYKGIYAQHIDPLKLSRIVYGELEPLLKEFLTWGAYPSVVVAKTEEQKKEALKHIMQMIIAKDVSFWFNKEDINHFEEIMHIINDKNLRIHNKRSIKSTHNITSTLIDKYTRFLEDHFLITTLSHFFTDKKREVSHKKSSVLLDMGIKNYFSDTFNVNINDPVIMRNYAIQQIYKNIAPEETIYTYKKINGSEIDFLVSTAQGYIPVVVGNKNTASIPKVFMGFETLYGDKVPFYIKTSPSFSGISYIEGKPVYIIPYFLVGKYLRSIAGK